MMDPEMRRMMTGLVQAELAMLATGAALLGRWSEIALTRETAIGERLMALAREEKPVYPDSYEKAAADVLALWRDAVRQMAGLPRLSGMRYYTELAESCSDRPLEVDPRGV